MAKNLNYTCDVRDEDAESLYDAIVKSAPVEQLHPVPSGTKFTRIQVTMTRGMPLSDLQD